LAREIIALNLVKESITILPETSILIIIEDLFSEMHRWLVKHDLTFDELHLLDDKSVLFEHDCHVVVDDAPYILQKAAEKGLKASGLSFPWNRQNGNNGYRLFHSHKQILKYILNGNKRDPD